jgi:2,4-dienoyl-CoA reductase-like NADH-dependent reductase (Old Yellow Enzyme family)/thioredoxin reductase
MNLESEGTIGSRSIPNRGVFRAVRTGLADDGRPTADLAAHLAARAGGGAGLVVGPAHMLVHPSASGPTYVDAYDETNADGLAAVADAIHEEDALVFGQLTHTGAEETGDWEMQAQLAPSPAASDAAYEIPKQLDRDELDSIRAGFVTAAENVERAGFDGVELNAGPFSVLRQFLSPRYNTRTDEYGGDLASRARFVGETTDAVAGAIDGPVGLHLSLAELEYGGYEFDDAPEIVAELDGFDYLSVTVGTDATFNQTHAGVSTQSPDLLDPIRQVAERVDVPVMGRLPFTRVDDAEALFDAGAEFVSFTRQLLADERTLARAFADGDAAGVTTRCIECNQKCLEGVYGHAHGGHVECVVNPRTGREADLPAVDEAEPAAIPQRVLVVGGGAAGLRFAAVAAARDHDVTIREADDELGGQLRLAAQGPLAPLSRATEDLVAAAEHAGVTVETGVRVDADAVGDEWDAVVVATGATAPDLAAYDFEGAVVDALDVLDGAAVGDDVLLVDDNRWVITMQTGLELAARCESVEIVTTDHYPGFRTEQPNLPGFVAGLQAQGVTFTGHRLVTDVDAEGTVHLRNTLTGDADTRHPETVVVAGRRQADESLYRVLKERRDGVYRIGDAVSPRKLDRAYYDGELLARRL